MVYVPIHEDANIGFYSWYMKSEHFQSELEKVASGTTNSHIRVTPKETLNWKIVQPPLPEQRRISEILDTIDEAIQKTEPLIEKLKAMKQGLLHDLLTRGLDENGKLRDPKAHPEQFKEPGSMPRSWLISRVDELLREGVLVEVQDGNHGELHPKTSDFVSDGVPFLMAKDLQGGKIDFEACYRITWRQYKSLRVGFSKPCDVLLTHKGTIGLTAIVPDTHPHVMLTPQVTLYRMGATKRLLPDYLFWYFQSSMFQQRLEILSAQSTRAYIGIRLQGTLDIVLPSLREQRLIVDVLDSHDTRMRTEEQYRDKLKLQKKGLMHDLLTGKVRVKVNDNVARC